MATGVYQITCLPTGRRYVGSTALSFPRRWDNHKSELRRGVHVSRYLQHSWTKYGPDAFTFSVLEYCAPELCISREQVWLDQLRPEFNTAKIAGSTLGVKMPASHRAAVAERMRNTTQSPETIERRRQSRAGYRHSDETRARMSLSAGHAQSEDARRKMSVTKRALGPKYDIRGESLTAKDISERYGLKYNTVHERIRRGLRGDALIREVKL